MLFSTGSICACLLCDSVGAVCCLLKLVHYTCLNLRAGAMVPAMVVGATPSLILEEPSGACVCVFRIGPSFFFTIACIRARCCLSLSSTVAHWLCAALSSENEEESESEFSNSSPSSFSQRNKTGDVPIPLLLSSSNPLLLSSFLPFLLPSSLSLLRFSFFSSNFLTPLFSYRLRFARDHGHPLSYTRYCFDGYTIRCCDRRRRHTRAVG